MLAPVTYLTDAQTGWLPYVLTLAALGLSAALSARDWRVMAGAAILVVNWLACQAMVYAFATDTPLFAFIVIDTLAGAACLGCVMASLVREDDGAGARWLIVLAVTYAVQLVGHAAFSLMHSVPGSVPTYRNILLLVAWCQLFIVSAWGIGNVVGVSVAAWLEALGRALRSRLARSGLLGRSARLATGLHGGRDGHGLDAGVRGDGAVAPGADCETNRGVDQ